MNKILIGTIVGSAAAVSIATAILLGVIVNNTPKPVRTRETVAEETEETERKKRRERIGDDETEPEETEETRKTKPTQNITEDSIFAVMDGMTSEEVVNNVWKTTRIKVGTTKEEYASRFVFPREYNKANSAVDNFYWQFVVTGKVKFLVLSCAVKSDYETHTVTELNKDSFVEAQLIIRDREFAKEVFEKFIERYKAEGYAITEDIGPTDDMHYRVVTFEGNGTSFRISHIMGANEKTMSTLDIRIPIPN